MMSHGWNQHSCVGLKKACIIQAEAKVRLPQSSQVFFFCGLARRYSVIKDFAQKQKFASGEKSDPFR